MRYRVVYLSAGERNASHVEACDAAGAVAIVARCHGHGPAAFELLSVVPEAIAPSGAEPTQSAPIALGSC